jgi:hypothetical protein
VAENINVYGPLGAIGRQFVIPCHSRESGNPETERLFPQENFGIDMDYEYWIPAFAGMTDF